MRIDSLLPAGTGIPGNVDTITGGGIIFSLEDGSYSNLFHGTYPPTPSPYEFHTVSPYPDGLVPPNTQSFIGFEARMIGEH